MELCRRVIALGFFDGVHIGHGALLACAVRRAKELGAVSAALTFDGCPGEVISGKAVPLLTTPEERAGLMRRLYGVQEVLVTPFDGELMHMDWQDFVTGFLVRDRGAVHLVAGHDFHFGWRGQGDPEGLRRLCAQLGVGCDIIPPVQREGAVVSSTRLRALIQEGDMERAVSLLGHPFALTDQVRHGKKLGSRLGFPTVNLRLPPGGVTPAFGVYATRIEVEGGTFSAVTNVGVRPTVDDGGAVTVEGFLLDFEGSLYGKTVRLEFYHRLRPERKFETLDALRAQVMSDAEAVRRYFAAPLRP